MINRFGDVLYALRLEPGSLIQRPSGSQELLVHWEAPLAGWLLLNTDGASKGNPGVAATGGVIRGDRGEWIFR